MGDVTRLHSVLVLTSHMAKKGELVIPKETREIVRLLCHPKSTTNFLRFDLVHDKVHHTTGEFNGKYLRFGPLFRRSMLRK